MIAAGVKPGSKIEVEVDGGKLVPVTVTGIGASAVLVRRPRAAEFAWQGIRWAPLVLAFLLAGCSTAEDRKVAAAREEARGALAAARCEYTDTIANHPDVQAACDDVRLACYDGPLPELRATAKGCEAATARLSTAATR
jgi:hypothetical protein